MPKDLAILTGSKDPAELIRTAVEFAGSASAADQQVLVRFLNSTEFLFRLNTAHEYNTWRPKQLRVAKVLRVLRDSKHSSARQTLITLSAGGDFINDNWLRQELLVRALVTDQPASPQSIAYWDSQSTPMAVNRHITIEVLCDNGSPPAMALLEKKLLDPAQEIEYRIVWMRDPMLRHRNDVPLLKAADRMVRQTLPPNLRLFLLEALCDYDPDWYPGCSRPKPPPRMLASAEAKDVLREICRYARDQIGMSPKLESAVRSTLMEIGNREKEA
jgi:hypothetical protein